MTYTPCGKPGCPSCALAVAIQNVLDSCQDEGLTATIVITTMANVIGYTMVDTEGESIYDPEVLH